MTKHISYRLQNGCWNCKYKYLSYCNMDNSYIDFNFDEDMDDNLFEKIIISKRSMEVDDFGFCNLWEHRIRTKILIK